MIRIVDKRLQTPSDSPHLKGGDKTAHIFKSFVGSPRLKYLIELLSVLLSSCVLWIVLSKVSFIRQNPANHQTLLLAILIIMPTAVFVIKRVDLSDYGISFRNGFRSIRTMLLFMVWILPLFIVVLIFFQFIFLAKPIRFAVPEHFLIKCIHLLFFVSLPEEYFFRGYLQSALNRIFKRSFTAFKARIGPGLFITAFLFVFAHTGISGVWDGFFGIFPALIFGWLRDKTENVLASIIFHWICDVIYVVLLASFV